MDPDANPYTHGHHDAVLRSHRWRTVENSAAYLRHRLNAGTSVLDVGCGPGTITLDMAQRVAPGRVLGIDASASVVAEATSAADASNVEFAVGDLFALGEPAGPFDVVHAHQVLQHVADPVGALQAMRRHCAPGGVVAARDSDYGAMTWYPADPALDRWLDVYSRAARANRGEPDAGRYLLAWAHAAGFSEVVPSASVWCFATPDDRSWWGDLWAERITATALADQALARRLATRTELDEMGRAWRRWAEHPDAWFTVVHGEVLCR
ncbi:MAG TPA: methyltransferase domain-containing protein [Acidimicrobiia bacterium]|jgi:2-polyprenyl-3-methyl-5-hydroxy-6-metoxy-1,4-benzoquinol methylase